MARRKVNVLGRTLELSNLDKVLYPQAGFTKAHVLDYYRTVSPWLLPHLRARPLTLKRYPDGVEKKPFYEKRCPSHRPDWMATATVEHRDGKQVRYCSVVDLPSLMWTANMASLELHVLLSRAMAPKRPNAVVFDLDPGPPAGLLDAAAIALRLLRVLNGIGLRVTAKVSGGKGVHCYVPLNTPADFRQTKDFARTVARRIERHYPDDVVSKMRKAAREGKVFIDWSQNDEYKTTVCPYSLRAGARPTVAAPVEWKELQHAVDRQDEDALRFTPADMAERLRDKGDLLHDVLTLRQRLPGAEPVRVEGLSTWTGEDNPRKGDPAEATDTDPEALAEYRRKRDFSGTPEPSGEQAGTADLVGTFVIQKHHATALHYDLRLECDGVLKSWAVPKGPSPDPDEKRLAVEVEDHPLEYARFEGRIPRGEYGGGSVVVWDRGAFEVPGAEARNDAVREGMKEGKLEFRLQGVKLQGRYLLVRTGKQSNGKPQWLLMKREDAAAQASVDPVETEPYSVISGLWVEDLQEAGEHGKQTRSK